MKSNMFPPDRVNTKIAGVASGSKDSNGDPIRQRYLKELEQSKVKSLRLVRERENKFDRDAIAVKAELSFGEVQLGYIQNRNRICSSCGTEFESPKSDNCPQCEVPLSRNGLATELSKFIDQGIEYKAKVQQVTGGENSKFKGCNILIERVL